MAYKLEGTEVEETVVESLPELAQWIHDEVAAGGGTYEELIKMIVDGFDRWEQSGITLPPNCRRILLQTARTSLTVVVDADFTEVRDESAALSFTLLARAPRDRQVQAIAELLRRAAELDKPTQNLRGAITELEKRMSREEVWRTLQATADNYREGQPLSAVDRTFLYACEHLDAGVLADANDENGSKAHDPRRAVYEKRSKAKSKEKRSQPLPSDVRGVDARDRYPVLVDLLRIGAATIGAGVELVTGDGDRTVVVEPKKQVADPQQPVADPEQG